MRKLSIYAEVALVALATVSCSIASAQTRDDNAALELGKYVELKQFSMLKSSEKVAKSNLQQKQVIQAALAQSAALKEAQASKKAASEDVAAARGAKAPQVTIVGQSLYTDGDLASASKATGKPGVTLSTQYTIYDWGRLDAIINARGEIENSVAYRQEQLNRQIASDALGACLELNKQRALLSANYEYAGKIRDLVERLNKITESDPGRAGELVQTRSRLLQADSSIETVRTKVNEVLYRLERVLGPGQQYRCEGLGSGLLDTPTIEGVVASVINNPQLKIIDSDYRQQLRAVEQFSASRKPQFAVTAAHAPVSVSLSNDYQQSLNFTLTAPIYDGNQLKSGERAALERGNAALERKEEVGRQLTDDLKQRQSQALRNIERANEYVSLLEINRKVRDDFFTQWIALGRRSLFELLAIEAEQFSLETGYFTSLYDGMTGVAYLKINSGELDTELVVGR